MPPLDWSIVQSAFLNLILPGIAIPAVVMLIATALIKSDGQRDAAAFLAMSLGFASGNALNRLVPFNEIDTGWRGLFWATLLAGLSERIIVRFFPKSSRFWSSCLASIVTVAVIAVWLMEWDPKESMIKLWLLMSLVMLLNWHGLNLVSQRLHGHWVPMLVAMIWGGSATALLILSHSARFADLSILVSCGLFGVGLIVLFTRQRLTNCFAQAAVFFPGLMLAAALNTYSEIPHASFILIGIQPALLSVLHFKMVSEWFERHPKALALVSLVPGLIAVGLAARAEL